MELKKIPETDLLQKYLDGSMTEAEGIALFEWLKENSIEGDAGIEELLHSVYEQSLAEKPGISAEAGRRILSGLLDTMNKEIPAEQALIHPMPAKRRPWMRYAAAAILIIAVSSAIVIYTGSIRKDTRLLAGTNRTILKLANGKEVFLDSVKGNIVQNGSFSINNNGGVLNYLGNTGPVEYHTLSTPHGKQYRVQLPDGTNVWLNARSSITYPTAFVDKQRKVTITGEAYFEVAQNQEKPFIADINGEAAVEVLGTHFNISAYKDDPGIYATLLEGRIKISNQTQSAMLNPGQQALISQQQMKVVDHADIDQAIAWKNGVFRFDHTRLDDVMRQLARWYEIEVVYEGSIPAIVLSGEIKRDAGLPQALAVLNTMGLRFRLEGNKVIIATGE
jgi:transmembrane sensor